MTDRTNEVTPAADIIEEPGQGTNMETFDQVREEEPKATTPGNFREASYVVLFIAAIFVINAMETGSYRTPWPVAIVTALLGFGLLGFSFMHNSSSNK